MHLPATALRATALGIPLKSLNQSATGWVGGSGG
jgi:hypothetical protein